MQVFRQVTGLVAPLNRSHVDTDAIIPKQYLKSIKRSGFGENLFDEWRYLDPGQPGDDHSRRRINPAFVLNQPRYQGAEILLARNNFGCGSSREHAVWALSGFGFKAVVASSFADIFLNNSLKNGLLPVVLDGSIIERLFRAVEASASYRVTVDLEARRVVLPDGETIPFEVDEQHRQRMLLGLDDISITLEHAPEIRAYERSKKQQAPWLF